jgi:hypothetical protein
MTLKLLAIAMGLIAAILGYIGYDRFAKSQIVFASGTDTWQMLQAGSRDGPVLVRTLGDAMGLSADILNTRTVETLRASVSEPWLRFETDPAKTQNPFGLTFLFDGPSQTRPNYAQLCAGTLPVQQPQSADIYVYAVLCGPNGPVNAAQGWTKRPDSADAAVMGRLIVQIGFAALRGKT